MVAVLHSDLRQSIGMLVVAIGTVPCWTSGQANNNSEESNWNPRPELPWPYAKETVHAYIVVGAVGSAHTTFMQTGSHDSALRHSSDHCYTVSACLVVQDRLDLLRGSGQNP